MPVFAQQAVKLHLFGGHAAAKGDGFSGRHVPEQKGRGLGGRRKDVGFKAPVAQGSGCFFKVL